MSALADAQHVLTVEEAAKVLRIGRSAAYEAARRGDIPTLRIGRSLRVPRHRLEAMLGVDTQLLAPNGAEGSANAERNDKAPAATGALQINA